MANPNHADNAKETPLMAAAMHGFLQVSQSPHPHPRPRPLALAFLGLTLRPPRLLQTTIALLAVKKTDVDAASEDGETALMLAIGEHHQAIATALG